MKFIYCLLLFHTLISAQTEYPKDYFRLPLDISIQLSGNFGELRPNHFHAGFDFRTQQKEGFNVYAAADGYVSRIKISTFGNGKAIYITHPNGFTTVYGHLQRGVGLIEEYIKKQHYVDKAYEIEMFPNPNELIVNKGDLIALSGNTGGSEGPHLHFEFRNTETEKIINPFFFGFDSYLKDTKKPIITSILAYPLDENSVVSQSKRPVIINLSQQKDGTYLSENVLARGKIGFGIQTYDLFDNSYDHYGVFKVQSFLNGNLAFGFQFETFAFDETRYINAFIDYSKYKTTNQRFEKLFMKNPYPLSIIQTNFDNGVISVLPNFSNTYRVEVSDYAGNKSIISIPIQYSPLDSKIQTDITKTKYLVNAKTDSNFELDNYSVFFPAGTFYDDLYLDFRVENKILTVHNDLVAVNNSFLVTIIDSTIVDDGKTFIGSVNNNNKITYNLTKRKDNAFSTNSRNLGKFTLVKDSIAPKITISKSVQGKWISSQKSIQLTINDALSGIKSYNGFLNGKWVLFEYESKTRKITHKFDDNYIVNGKNDLKVEVIDNVGNSTIFETQFFRNIKK